MHIAERSRARSRTVCPEERRLDVAPYRVLVAPILALLLPTAAWSQSALEVTADAMAADSWAVPTMTNVNIFLDPEAASGFITEDGVRGCWDPVLQRAHFVGVGHHNPPAAERHVMFTASTNTWTERANPPFGTSSIHHGWDGNVCDPIGR